MQRNDLVLTLAQRVAASRRWRHLLFLICTLICILITGYHYGTFDQAIHIPFLKAFVDPTLFPGDEFVAMRTTHYSFFWSFFRPFYQWGVLEPVLFIGHFITTYLTFWLFWKLSVTLFDNPLASLFSVLVFAIPRIGFAAFPVIEFSLLNRTFVLPFLLLALDLFLRGRRWLAYWILGLLCNLHVVSVNFGLVMVFFATLAEFCRQGWPATPAPRLGLVVRSYLAAFRRTGWRDLVVGPLLFISGALPVLVWKAQTSSSGISLDRQWFDLLTRAYLAHLFFLFSRHLHVWLITICGLSTLALFFVTRRAARAGDVHRIVTFFVWAVIIVLVIEQFSAWWLPLTLIVQLQIMRIGLFATIFGYLYFANWLAQLYQTKSLAGLDLALLGGGAFFLPIPAAPLLLWAAQRLRSLAWRRIASGALIVGFGVLTLVAARAYNIWSPGIYIYPEASPWLDVQVWARENTPKDTLFITPPEKWWFYEPEWRVFSERSTLATLSELLEAAFNPEYTAYWQPRFEAVAPGVLRQACGNIFENITLTHEAYYALSDTDLHHVACTYNVSYIVSEKPHLRPWTVAYENAGFVVYWVEGCDR